MRKFTADPEFWHFQETFSPFVLNMGKAAGDRRWQREPKPPKPPFGIRRSYQSQQRAVGTIQTERCFLVKKDI